MDYSREKIEVFEVDEDGNIIESYSWDPYEINEAIDEGRYIIQHGWENGLYEPKWSFEKNKWVHGISEEEILELKNQPTPMSESDIQTLAIFELAMEIEKLKGGN